MKNNWVLTIWCIALVLLGLMFIQVLRQPDEVSTTQFPTNDVDLTENSVAEHSTSVEITYEEISEPNAENESKPKGATVSGYVVYADTGEPLVGP
jgi:hypothetical protein